MDKKITDSIIYIGVDDKDIDLFESQYVVPNGVSYNSYVIMDDKIAIMDTADARVTDKWFANLREALGDRKPDYLVVSHLEPDHASNIQKVAETYPDMQIVGNAKTFNMMGQFFDIDLTDRKVVVAEGDKLSLGKHELTFVMAPMVHWPEVMMTYDTTDKIFFSADAFGKFGALDVEEEWDCEARRYYIGIVGKYGPMVQKLFGKVGSLEIKAICPLHGPVLTENLEHYLNLYNISSSYQVETEGTVIAYTSVYGNTKKAVELLAEKLKEEGCPKVVVTDLARDDMAEAVEDAFRYGKLILATTTYNGDIFPFMKEFINHLTERSYQNRTIGFVENGSWTPMAAKIMKAAFEKSKNITFADLKGTLQEFAARLFGPETKVKFRPHHFPFTEPSAEMDVTCFKCGGKGCRFCKGSGWIEILGCGMVHPHVLEMCGIDPEKYTGFAFGVGLERIALLKYEIDDMRLLYENDTRFLNQF